MKLVRFLAKAYAGGRIVEAGEEVMMPDDFPMGRHTVDVAEESEALANGHLNARITQMAPVENRPDAVFRTDLAHDITASAGVPVFPTWEAQKALDALTVHSADAHPAIDRPILPGHQGMATLGLKPMTALEAPKPETPQFEGETIEAEPADPSGD